jgi:hypothetical protein
MQVAVCFKNSEAFSVNLVKFGGFIYNKIEEKIFTMSGKVKRTETSVGQRNMKHIFFPCFRLLQMSKSRPKVRWIYRLVLDLQEFR